MTEVYETDHSRVLGAVDSYSAFLGSFDPSREVTCLVERQEIVFRHSEKLRGEGSIEGELPGARCRTQDGEGTEVVVDYRVAAAAEGEVAEEDESTTGDEVGKVVDRSDPFSKHTDEPTLCSSRVEDR
jgi:hypothetical protein